MTEAVLFDLDGTFADTAPDLAAALNRLRAQKGLDALPVECLRSHASAGTRGMLGAGLGLSPGHEEYWHWAGLFLRHYGEALCVGTTLFPGIEALVRGLEASRLKWGIVTNKPQRYTLPLLEALGWGRRPDCVVSGDSSRRPKPAPDPLLLAARVLDVPVDRCIYVGDDLRDIEAARAAGMRSIAVRYGYLGESLSIEEWGADAIAESPLDVLRLVGRS